MPKGGQFEGKRLEIRKYPNRRYYDATHSRHLTLEQIRSLVRQGHDIRVIDSKTSADITAQVLTQVILELETPKLDLFPIPLLVRLIRLNDQFVKDFFSRTLLTLLDQQQEFEERLRQSHALPASFPSLASWSRAWLEPLVAPPGTSASTNQSPSASAPAAAAPASGAPGEELRRQVQALQDQLNALQKQVRQRRHPRPRRAKKGKARKRR